MSKKVTVPEIMASKGQRRVSELTAYDYPTALWADKSGVDMLLVGDSLAMVVLGQEDTLSVGMTEMLHHTLAVSRGAKRALVIGDMPFMSYQASVEQALINAGRFMKEARASAVKLEGGSKGRPAGQGNGGGRDSGSGASWSYSSERCAIRRFQGAGENRRSSQSADRRRTGAG